MPNIAPAPHAAGIVHPDLRMDLAWVQWFDDIRTRTSDGHKDLLSGSFSDSSALDVVSDITADYEHYRLVLQNVRCSQAGANLQLRVSNNLGTSYESGAADYTWIIEENNGTVSTTTDAEDTEIHLMSPSSGTGTSNIINGSIELFSLASTDVVKFIRWDISYKNSSNELVLVKGTGIYNTAEAIDALRVSFSSGDITSGQYKLYGIR